MRAESLGPFQVPNSGPWRHCLAIPEGAPGHLGGGQPSRVEWPPWGWGAGEVCGLWQEGQGLSDPEPHLPTCSLGLGPDGRWWQGVGAPNGVPPRSKASQPCLA
jgi:hypothetical protein